MKANYDQLSDLGHQQALLLGAYWKENNFPIPDLAFSGSLRRQKETGQNFLRGLEIEMDVNEIEGLNEHQATGIVRAMYPDEFKKVTHIPQDMYDTYRKKFHGTYFKLAIQWINNQLPQERVAHIEPWQTFRTRSKMALESICKSCPKGGVAVVFTSAGTLAAMVGDVLGLSEEQTMRLGWNVRNASYSEFLYGSGRLSLVTFNETPHLSTEVITLV